MHADEYVRGIQGLALLRAASAGDLPAGDVAEGYSEWAATYDRPGNATMAVEEPAVLELLRDLPDGVVLDAACGTGRYLAHLCAMGHPVIGVDSSPEMLAVARTRAPDADLREGALEALPLEDGSVSGAVCALALSHLTRLGPAVAELRRVLVPGGRLIVSNPHPLATGILRWRATFVDRDGTRRRIPEHPHLAADYVEAFAGAGLAVRRLLEPRLDAAQARAQAPPGHDDLFELALTGLPAAIVWEAEALPRGRAKR